MNASVTTTAALSKDDKQIIEKLLKQKFGEITTTYYTDSDLLGGIRIEVGDWVFDGSVARELSQLVNVLKS